MRVCHPRATTRQTLSVTRGDAKRAAKKEHDRRGGKAMFCRHRRCRRSLAISRRRQSLSPSSRPPLLTFVASLLSLSVAQPHSKSIQQSVQTFGRKKTAVAVAHVKRGKGLLKLNGKKKRRNSEQVKSETNLWFLRVRSRPPVRSPQVHGGTSVARCLFFRSRIGAEKKRPGRQEGLPILRCLVESVGGRRPASSIEEERREQRESQLFFARSRLLAPSHAPALRPVPCPGSSIST